MLLWPCGLLSETPPRFLLMHSPLLLCLPSHPPSTTLWSTCCVSQTFVSVSTETRQCYDRGSTGEVHSQIRKNASDPPRSATRTWASPRGSQTDSRRAMGRVCTALRMQSCVTWPLPKGRPASWLDPPTERWQSAGSQPNHRLNYSSNTTSSFCEPNKTGQVLKKTDYWAWTAKQQRTCSVVDQDFMVWQHHRKSFISGPFHSENFQKKNSHSACFIWDLPQKCILAMSWCLLSYQLVSCSILICSNLSGFWGSRKWDRKTSAGFKVN